MDDLKLYWNQAVKHSFWILSGLILLLSGIVFYLVNSGLGEAITTRFSAVEAKIKKVNDIRATTPTHPNDYSHKQMQDRLVELKGDVEKAWQLQYNRQKELLYWPREAFSQDSIYEIFDNLRPFEKKVPFPLPNPIPTPLDKITPNDRKVFRDFFRPEFDRLAAQIGSTWKATEDPVAASGSGSGYGGAGFGGSGMPGMVGNARSEVNEQDLVRWAKTSQAELLSTVMPWYSKPTPPTIHQIYYTQEDIWLLRGLMEIIKETNKEANENFQTSVKEIEWIRFGAKASREAGVIYPNVGGGGGGGGGGGSSPYGGGGPPANYGGGGGNSMPSGYGAGGQGGRGGAASEILNQKAAAREIDPADDRYLDANFKPLSGAALRSAMRLTNAADAINAVAKRIPVRMRLKVDPAKINNLLVECGNAKMMLEVYQVRLNTDAADAVGEKSGGGASGGKEGGKPSLGGVGSSAGTMAEEGASSAGVSSSQTGGKGSAQSLAEVPVEIFGIVYLFNAPENLSSTNTSAAPAAAAAPTGAAAGAKANATAPANTAPTNTTPTPPPAGKSDPMNPEEGLPGDTPNN